MSANKKMRNDGILPYIFILVIGLILFSASVFVFSKELAFDKRSAETSAMIMDVRIERTSNGRKVKKVYVEFNAGKNRHSAPLNTYVSDMKIGDVIKIKYDPENPSNFRKHNNMLVITIIALFCSLPVIIGTTLIIRQIMKNKKRAKLKNTLLPITATIRAVNINKFVMISGNSTFDVICEYTDPLDNKTYTFIEEAMLVDLEPVVRENNIKEIQVYVDLKKPEEYVVDVESLKKYL